MTSALPLAALALLAGPGPDAAPGEPPRVVLLGPEPALSRALATALAPWDIELVERARASDDPAAEARTIAREAARVAVVWMGASLDGKALFVFDGMNGQLVTRPLGGAGPLDEPLAAAAALSVKTMLRFTSVAPARERIDAEVAPAPPRLRAEASGGARIWNASGDRVEPAFGLGLSYWPRATVGRLGVSLELRLGTGLAVDAAGFAGRFTDYVAAAALRWRFPWGRSALVPAAAAGLHVSSLTGSTTAEGPVDRTRVNPSLDAGLRLEFAPRRLLELGAAVAASYLLREQRYLLAGEPLFATAPLCLHAEIFVEFPFL